jgi:hypothetical protein
MKAADNKDAYVYRHRRASDMSVFYVGIGVIKRRAWSKNGRNRHWHNIVNKHGFKYEIIADGISRDDAKELEMFLISQYGRMDLGNGQLVNMTGGGDGMYDISVEAKHLLSERRKGRKHHQSTKSKMSEAQSRGKHSQAKKVIDLSNGVIYDCIKDAAESYGIGYHNLKDKLSGRKGSDNYTSLRYYNGD